MEDIKLITQDELIKGILNFINTYERLPYINGDDIEVEKINDEGEIELRPFRSIKYVRSYFGDHNKCTEYLLDNNILTYDLVEKHTQIKASRVKSLLSGKATRVNWQERWQIDKFFNNDFYTKLDKYAKRCMSCSKSKECGQDYWVEVVHCAKYNKK